MKKIMGHLTGKLSLSILTVIVLLVGVLAGLNGITSMKASGRGRAAASRSSQQDTASATPASSKAQASSSSQASAAPAPHTASAAPPASKAPAPTNPLTAQVVTKDAAIKAAGKLPLTFEPNRGQTDSRVKYLARSLGYQVFLNSGSSAVMGFRPSKNNPPDVLTMNLDGANSAAVGRTMEPTGGVSNYYIGNDHSIQNIPQYAKVRYDGVYPGIDVVYQGDNSHFRYDFQVNPGADPQSIHIAYQGGKGLSIDKNGNAVVDLTSGHMVSSKPVMYQEYGGQKHAVTGNYVLSASNTVSFEVGSYDKNQVLTIDPSNTYASFVAGAGSGLLGDEITSVAVDSTGVYMAGWSQSAAYPSTCGAGGTILCAGTMAMILKMNLNLTAAPTAAYFGGETGSSVAIANGVAVLNQLPVIVGEEDAGSTWPVKAALELSPSSITPHAFAMKLTSALAQTWSTVLSGSGTETANAVALDAAGNVHITGGTTSGTSTGTPGPSTFLCNLIGAGAALNPPGGCTSTLPFKPYQSNQASSLIEDNAFYVEIASAGTSALYGTLFGGFANDIGNGIAVDTATPVNAYIVGTSNSFGAGTVVGFTGLPGGSDCVNPVITIPAPPVPPSASAAPGFFGVAQAAQGAAIVNDGEIMSITITNPGAGYPTNGSSPTTVPVTITGCGSTPSVSAIILTVTGSTSANNLPIPGSTITLTNPGTGYAILAPPAVTFSGGSCTVEPTAVAIVSIVPPFGLSSLVLEDPGTGCTSPPTVSIAAPPTVANTAAGQTATATYTPGTQNITLFSDGLTPANPHAFVAKFTPSATPVVTTTSCTVTGACNPGSLSYAVVIGGTAGLAAADGHATCTVSPTGSVPAGTPANTPPTQECEAGTGIAVDQYGNAYVGGNSLIPVGGPFTNVDVGIYNGSGTTSAIFTSPGTAGGVVTSITLTNAGLGYSASTVSGTVGSPGPGGYFAWTNDINGGCLHNPMATYTVDGDGSILAVTVTDTGFGCTSIPTVVFTGGVGATAIAALGTEIAGNPNVSASNNPTGFVLELVSNQVINFGLTTTSTQDGIPLGPHVPSSVAGWPAMVYATWVAGDEDCTTCTYISGVQSVTGGFGNGAVAPPPGNSLVTGVAVDSLGQTYVSGSINAANTPTGAAQYLLLRRRVNAKGYPTNPLTAPYTDAEIKAPNTQFLTDFPVPPNGGGPNTGITPFGSVDLGLADTLPNIAGSFLGVGFDPVTLTACWGGFVSEATVIAAPSATSIFPNGTGPEPPDQPKTLLQAYSFTAPTPEGFAACTQFDDDLVVGTIGGGTPTPTSITFNVPTGTQSTLPGGGVNPVFPTPITIVGTLDTSAPTGATVTLGNITLQYYQGKNTDAAGDGPDSSTATDILWLNATPLGSTVQLSLNPSTSHSAPGAPFLDPGTYYVLVTVTPTVSGGAADNANIPQTVIVTLNVTGTVLINTASFGGVPVAGSNAAGTNVTLSLTQGTVGTAAWNGGTLDAAGNLVLNIPFWSNVPLNSPTHGNFVSLLYQGTLANPQPSTGTPFQILGTGLNTGNPVLIGSTTGSVFMQPSNAVVEFPGAVFGNDEAYLPPGGLACDPPNTFSPPDTNDPNSKSGATGHVACYIQVILPPTILEGAPTGANTVTLTFMSIPNLTDPETPVRNDHSHPYLGSAAINPTTGLPTTALCPTPPNGTAPAAGAGVPGCEVESFCVGSTCSTPSGIITGGVTGALTLTIDVNAGPLIINSPWISNTITSCLTAPIVGPGPFFSVPVCNTNGPQIPLAPFTVPTGYNGTVTSNINSFSDGNNPLNPYNNVVLDSKNLGLTAPGTYTATAAPGLGSVNLGTIVSAAQVANDFYVYQFFSLPTIYPVWDVPTCTLTTPAIPAGVLSFPTSGVLPASNAPVTTTAFTISIVNPAAANLANGFYASTITVTPNTGAAFATQIPVCLEVGNNVITEFESIPQPTTVPPPFDPTGNIVPPDGLLIESGHTQYVQVIAQTLGPNQTPPISAGPTFGTPSFVAVPVTITPNNTDGLWCGLPGAIASCYAFPLTAPPNIGNEFSLSPLGTITEGIYSATNCSLVTGAPNGPCFTDAYMDFVIAAPSGSLPPGGISLTLDATGSGLLGATDAPLPIFTVTLPVIGSSTCTGGPCLVWTTGEGTQPSTPGVVAYFTVIPSDLLTGGAGYTSVPNVSFSGGCTTEPTAVAVIDNPGAAGYVSQISLTSPGAGCTSAPVVTIDPPSTVGGITAAAEAFISNGTLAFTFNEVVDAVPATSATSCLTGTTPCTGPAYQTITVQSNVGPPANPPGQTILTPTDLSLIPTIYYNPPLAVPGITSWLNVTSFNCAPIIVNPTPLTECQFTLSINSSAGVLPVGTYYAYADFLNNGGGGVLAQPAIETAIITLNVTPTPPIVTSGLAAGIATFSYIVGGANTTPTSQTTELSVSALASGQTGIPFTAVASPGTSPADCPAPCSWITISSSSGTLTTSPTPLTITVTPGLLQYFNTPGVTYNGTVTVTTTPSGSTSNSPLVIPVTITVTGTPSLTFSSTGSTVTCGTPNAGGNTSCTATAAFTIGQVNSAPPSFSTVLTLNGSTPDSLTITSNVPWLVPSLSTTTQAVTPLTITINPALISPLVAGAIMGTVTAKGVNGTESATFTVTLTVANPPTITMTPITPQVDPFGTAPFTVTTQVALSSAPANPTSLPVSCTVTGGASWLSANSGNPTSISVTPATFSFTITPATVPQGNGGVGTFGAGQITCTTTGGITPALTDSIPVSLTVNGSLTITTPGGTGFGNYTIGTPPPTLPMGIASTPAGATVSIASSATWLSESTTPVTAGPVGTPTMVTVSVVTSDPAVVNAANGAVLTATLTMTAPQSYLDCAPPQGPSPNTFPAGVCTVVETFTVTIIKQPTLSTTPTSLTFNLPTNASPFSMSVAVTASSGTTPAADPYTATPAVTTPVGGTWLAATGGTTTIPPAAASMSTVTVSDGTLAQGTYAGAVAYASALTLSNPNLPVLLNVGTLTVTPSGPSAVNFAHEFGVTVPVTATLQVSSGPAIYNWVAAAPVPATGTPNCNWLIPGAAAGSTSGPTSVVTVGYNPAVLTPANANYSCTINFSPAAIYGASAADTVPVTINLVTSINPVWVISPNTTQTVTILVGATSAPTTTFSVAASSILAPATTISATVTPFANNPLGTGPSPTPIFTASAATLTVPATPGSVALTISENPAGLPVGTYQGSFTISSPSITTNAVVTVDLVVTNPATCLFVPSPTSLALTNAVPANGNTPVTVPGAFTVSPGTGCTGDTWTASSSAAWLVITGGGTGNGSTASSVTFNALSNPTSSNRTATITITPSSGTPTVYQVTQSTASPIAPIQNRQITALYQSILGRDPDTAGYDFWLSIYVGNATLGQLADAFVTSPEAFNTDFSVIAAYQAATGAPPDYAHYTNSVANVRLGSQTITGLFTALSNANPSYSFTTLYQNMLNRAPTASDSSCTSMTLVNCFVTLLGYPSSSTPVGPGTNLEFLSTGTFTSLHSAASDHTNVLYINELYFTILAREPDAGGLEYWLGIANSGGAGVLFQGPAGSPTRIQIEGNGLPNNGFIGSGEFQGLYQ
jgi:Putative binding domain, N-terminal/Domain of unknown function (DUF4214)